MRILKKTAPLLILMLALSSAASAQISFGIRIGPPPAPRAYYVPPQPNPSYEWIEGYWYPVGNHYKWHDGYWSLPPYAGAYWVAPWHDGRAFHAGYWEGGGRRFDHNHRWDRERARDFNRGEQRRDDRRDHR